VRRYENTSLAPADNQGNIYSMYRILDSISVGGNCSVYCFFGAQQQIHSPQREIISI